MRLKFQKLILTCSQKKKKKKKIPKIKDKKFLNIEIEKKKG